ncbi:MAG: conserved exported protein of unknown function [Rhodospirillaceae bacterium]|nr:MAG: conserved exported protein of unknown function [Rhodospirillaceae bacterium]
MRNESRKGRNRLTVCLPPFPIRLPRLALVLGVGGALFGIGLMVGIGVASLRLFFQPVPIVASPAPPSLPVPARDARDAPEPEPEPEPEYGEEGIADHYLRPHTLPVSPAVAEVAEEEPTQETASDPPSSPVSGSLPWQQYAVPVPPFDGSPQVAIVIDDLGIDRQRSSRAIRLPGPLTTAWLSYAHDLVRQTREARARGHELMIHVPMEPKNSRLDPGPDVLRTDMDVHTLKAKLDNILGRFPGYVGINNHMGSRFTTDSHAMTVVITELKRHGVLWLDSRTARDTVGPSLARRFGVPFAERQIFLDNENNLFHVRSMLQKLESLARRQGYALGIGHPRDATLTALKEWVPEAKRKGLVLVPVSAIVARRLEMEETGRKTAEHTPSQDTQKR